ncbi:MAG: hypothetical protein ACRCWQ_11385, partial [Bacilli bacterium]
MNKPLKVLTSAALAAALLLPTPLVGASASTSNITQTATLAKGEELLKPQTITSIGKSTVKLGQTSYTLQSNAHKQLFANKDALKKARIQVSIDSKNRIKDIYFLELNTPGKRATGDDTKTKGNLILNGGNTAIKGNLTVNADFITLKNLSINKNLTTTDKAKTIVSLDRVKVHGTTTFGQVHTTTKGSTFSVDPKRIKISRIVNVKNSQLNNVVNNYTNTSVKVLDKSNVKQILTSNFAIFNTNASATIGSILANQTVTALSLNGNIKAVVSNASNLTVWGTTNLDSLTSNNAVQLHLRTKGTISEVNVLNSNATLNVSKNVNPANISLAGQTTLLSELPLPKVTLSEQVTNFSLSTPVQQLVMTGETNLQLKKGSVVSLLTAQKNSEISAETGVTEIKELNLAGTATGLKLNAPTQHMNISTDTKETVLI